MCPRYIPLILYFIFPGFLYLSLLHRPCRLQGWNLLTSLWNSRKTWRELHTPKYGMCNWNAAGMAPEVGEQDLELLKHFYTTSRGLPGVFGKMEFTEHGGKRVQADVKVHIKEGPPLAQWKIEVAGHGASMYNLGSILVNGPEIGPNAASNKKGQKKYGFYCYKEGLIQKAWSYVSFVSLFGNGTLVGVMVLLRVDLSLQHDGHTSSFDQWAMNNLEGVHITGLHFRFIKQNILDMKPTPTLTFVTEPGWEPSLEKPFPLDGR